MGILFIARGNLFSYLDYVPLLGNYDCLALWELEIKAARG